MKKVIFTLAALSLLAACNDDLAPEQPVQPVQKSGTVVLDADFDLSTEEETKLSAAFEGYISYPYAVWDSEDQFELYTYPDSCYTSHYGDKKNFKATDCGAFRLTEGAGKSSAKFIGCIPDAATSTTNGLAFFPVSNIVEGGITFGKNSGQPVFGEVAFKIADQQDGSGYKYMSAISKFYKGKIKGFKLASSMWHMWVPESAEIDKIEVDGGTAVIATDRGYAYYKDDDSTKTSVSFGASTESKNKSKITIYNDGAKLSGDVFFVTRNLNSAISGAKLRFYNGSTLVKTVTFTMRKCGLGELIDLGCPFIGGYDKTVTWVSDSLLRSDKPAEYAEFPYCSSKKLKDGKYYYIYDITILKDEDTTKAIGHSGQKLTVLKAERSYSFSDKAGTYSVKFGGNNYFRASYSLKANLRMDSGAYMTTPVIAGKKLVGIKMTPVNAYLGTSGDLRYKVASDSLGTNVLEGGQAKSLYKLSKNTEYSIGKFTKDQVQDMTWWLSGTEVGKSYYLMSAQGSSQTSKVVFLYK